MDASMSFRKKPAAKKAPPADEVLEAAKNCPSLKKLEEMKEKMMKELEDQEKEKLHAGEGQVAPLSLAGEYKGGKERELAKWKPVSGGDRRESDMFAKQKEKLKDVMRTSSGREIRKDIELVEKERRELEMENQRLRDIINLRQECSIRREEKCQQEILDLKRRLDGSVMSGYDEGTLMSKLKGVNEDIQDEVHQLKGIIESQAEVEKMNLIRTFRVKMHELKKQLAEEQQVNYTGAQEWIEKNKVLQYDLDVATRDLNQLKEKNKQLVLENKELKVAFQNQERTRNGMINSIAVVRKENQRLEDQIEKLEFQCVQMAKKRAGDKPGLTGYAHLPSPVAAGAPLAPSAEKKRRYLEAINKMKKILEHDRKELKEARSQHMSLLAERTELEIFLRQTVDDVRKEITRNSKISRARPASQATTREIDISLDQYTASDRKRVLEILLSKERVLTLLYEKAFPYKNDVVERQREAESLDPAVLGVATEHVGEMDMNHLWAKWKDWTEG
uniref:Uncharacterized protein n=1 Tax=Eutreptiella gymnastica TaxID=73025 RepID=A0A7S1JAK0_9EUGL|mmetsp:Transcript_79620/g.140531  ORF Transcript_79620/g.140531 Transcript_79620/m.140531 type:complete len:504 (+) Transcript_79620:145-1656(+)